MSLEIIVDPEDLAALERKLAPGALGHAPLEHLLRDATRFTSDEAKSGAKDGAIVRHLTSEVREGSARVSSAVAAAVDAGDVESLREWAARKGIEEFLYPIAVHKRRGIRGRFFLERAREKLENVELPRLVARLETEIEQAWSK